MSVDLISQELLSFTTKQTIRVAVDPRVSALRDLRGIDPLCRMRVDETHSDEDKESTDI